MGSVGLLTQLVLRSEGALCSALRSFSRAVSLLRRVAVVARIDIGAFLAWVDQAPPMPDLPPTVAAPAARASQVHGLRLTVDGLRSAAGLRKPVNCQP
jgi:hypothetical protein